MFRALIQVASIKSFSGCHATTTLIQISTAKLSFLGSEVLDATPRILFRLSHELCSFEMVASKRRNLNKNTINSFQLGILIYNSLQENLISRFLLFWLLGNLIITSCRRLFLNANSVSITAVLPSSCLHWTETCQSIRIQKHSASVGISWFLSRTFPKLKLWEQQTKIKEAPLFTK